MPKRVSPTEALHDQIDAVFAEGGDLSGAIEKVARLGAQLLLQSALEAEVTEFLGRDRYQRGAGLKEARAGMRNGYCPTTVKTTGGPVTLQRPKLRGTSEKFASRLFGTSVTKTNALETLVIASFVRGLSTRDIEATLAESLGGDAATSKSTVSRIAKSLRTEFDDWRARRLDEVTLDYLFLDASFFRYHPGASAEAVLAAWGIDVDGRPVFVGLDTATGESVDAWSGFLTGLTGRGLNCPLLVISDGAPGLIGAVEQVFPAAARQRCLIHRCRNLVSKTPKDAQGEVKADYWGIFEVPETVPPGDGAVALVQRRIDAFAARWRDAYPRAVACLLDDRDSLTQYLRMPREHWSRARHSNLVERTFGETRRRVKVIGRLPGEYSCTSLVWAVLDRAAAGWRGFVVTPESLRRLQELRAARTQPPPTRSATSDDENTTTGASPDTVGATA